MAAAMVLWDFKTDGWPPVPISKASPRPRSPWIEPRLALAMLRQWFCGPCFPCHACYAWLVTVPPANSFSSMVFPTVSNALLEFVPTNARTTLLYDNIPHSQNSRRQMASVRLILPPLPLRKPCYDFFLLIRFMPTPHKQSRGVGGTRAIAHSIRRCRATGVAKLACYPGCCRCRRPPPSRCFLKVALKNDALACISEHFCILRISNLEKSEFSLKSFILLVFWRFLGSWGGQKIVKKPGKFTKKSRVGKGGLRGRFLDHF